MDSFYCGLHTTTGRYTGYYHTRSFPHTFAIPVRCPSYTTLPVLFVLQFLLQRRGFGSGSPALYRALVAYTPTVLHRLFRTDYRRTWFRLPLPPLPHCLLLVWFLRGCGPAVCLHASSSTARCTHHTPATAVCALRAVYYVLVYLPYAFTLPTWLYAQDL